MDFTMFLLLVGFLICMIMLVILVPLGLFLSLSGDLKLIARDINSIARFLENPPPLEMRTSMMADMHPHHSHEHKGKQSYNGGDNYL